MDARGHTPKALYVLNRDTPNEVCELETFEVKNISQRLHLQSSSTTPLRHGQHTIFASVTVRPESSTQHHNVFVRAMRNNISSTKTGLTRSIQYRRSTKPFVRLRSTLWSEHLHCKETCPSRGRISSSHSQSLLTLRDRNKATAYHEYTNPPQRTKQRT